MKDIFESTGRILFMAQADYVECVQADDTTQRTMVIASKKR
jgi:hypothetical protein